MLHLIFILLSVTHIVANDYTLDVDGHPNGWTQKSHSDSEPPDYALIFDRQHVQKIEIIIPSLEYDKMKNDMSKLYGIASTETSLFANRNPIYVRVIVHYNGKVWYHVGMRWKGKSSLVFVYDDNLRKLPFRLNFDKFEDHYKEIKNQRIYGFDKLTFANCFLDPTFMHEQLATEIYRDRGVPAPYVAQYAVYIDHSDGNGLTYYGLYSMVEDPSDQMIENQQFADGGTLYKPEGGYWNQFAEHFFAKKTKTSNDDYREIEWAIYALNSEIRLSQSATWRKRLSQVFDVDYFLNWLAVTSTIGNWDTYGLKPYNYYVYADPCDDRRLKWFPWDTGLSLTLPWYSQYRNPDPNAFTREWVIIRNILDDPVFLTRYKELLSLSLKGIVSPDRWDTTVNNLHQLITPFALLELTPDNMFTANPTQSSFGRWPREIFKNANNTLIDWMNDRRKKILTFLGNTSFASQISQVSPPKLCNYKKGTGVINGDTELVSGLRLSELMYHPSEILNSERISIIKNTPPLKVTDPYISIGRGLCRGINDAVMNSAFSLNIINAEECTHVCTDIMSCEAIAHAGKFGCIIYFTDKSINLPSGFNLTHVQNASAQRIKTTFYDSYDTYAYSCLIKPEPPEPVFDRENFEFIEFKNVGNKILNLGGAYFNWGIHMTFPKNTKLLPGRFILLVKNKIACSVRYNITEYQESKGAIIFEYNGSLSNSGELIVLKDIDGKTVLEVIYEDDWYPETDGNGYSLVSRPGVNANIINSLRTKEEFAQSLAYLGTPGMDDFIICPPDGCKTIPTSESTETSNSSLPNYTLPEKSIHLVITMIINLHLLFCVQ